MYCSYCSDHGTCRYMNLPKKSFWNFLGIIPGFSLKCITTQSVFIAFPTCSLAVLSRKTLCSEHLLIYSKKNKINSLIRFGVNFWRLLKITTQSTFSACAWAILCASIPRKSGCSGTWNRKSKDLNTLKEKNYFTILCLHFIEGRENGTILIK